MCKVVKIWNFAQISEFWPNFRRHGLAPVLCQDDCCMALPRNFLPCAHCASCHTCTRWCAACPSSALCHACTTAQYTWPHPCSCSFTSEKFNQISEFCINFGNCILICASSSVASSSIASSSVASPSFALHQRGCNEDHDVEVQDLADLILTLAF